MSPDVDQEVRALVRALYPGARRVEIEHLRTDAGGGDGETQKALGYGAPLRVCIDDNAGHPHELVLHSATKNEFGHDRRADRAAELLLAFDTFNRIPGHVRAIDVGAIASDGSLISLRDGGEFYLVTEYVPGTVYARDLRRIAHDGRVQPVDLERLDALVAYLAQLHALHLDHPASWRRAIRDLLGHGECIFGIVDGYDPEVPGVPPARLEAIERRCLEWRFRLRDRSRRLRRTHGDFHPFNIVFQEGTAFRVLDASRGSQGDPADDLAALAINFPFFALEHPAGWREGPGRLWHRFFERYVAATGDGEVLEVLPPFLAFRALVVCNPLFYPALSGADRDHLLRLVEEALAEGRLDPTVADALFP